MQLTLDEIVNATHGRASAPTAGIRVTGVGVDSRALTPGMLFVPLRAERDGHEFIDAARAAGAVAHLTEHPDDRPGAVRVDDTSGALVDLARHARDCCPTVSSASRAPVGRRRPRT